MSNTDLLTKEKAKVDIPKMYNVILLNDDYTHLEFVVYLLIEIFRKSADEAKALAEQVHNHGKGIAGTYTKDLAETKAMQSEQLAKHNGYPLKLDVQAL